VTEPKNWASEFPKYADFQRFQAAGAAASIEFDMRGMNELLSGLWISGNLMEEELKKIAFEMLARIAARTPVKTGRARNSWHVIGPNEQDSYSYSDDQGHAFDGSTGDAAGPLEAIVTSNVPYMLSLEAGHSRQAPHGMVAVTIAEFHDALNARVEAILREGFGG